MFTTIMNGLIDAFSAIISFILALLPQSPFTWQPSNEMAVWLTTINYFIPFNTILGVMVTYVAAVIIWYVWRLILRFVKMIG